MRRFMKRSRWVAALAAVGMCLPANAMADDAPAATPAGAKAPAEAKVQKTRDVALTKSGTFVGRVIDNAGKPLDGVVVRLTRRGEETPAETTTDAEGRFRFAKLKGGVYQLQTPQAETTYRMWTADSAPAQAMKTVVVNGAGPVMRAQLGYLDPANTTAILLGAAGVTLSAITLAQVDNLQDDVDKIPTSP
jgi:hypothetical protein